MRCDEALPRDSVTRFCTVTLHESIPRDFARSPCSDSVENAASSEELGSPDIKLEGGSEIPETVPTCLKLTSPETDWENLSSSKTSGETLGPK